MKTMTCRELAGACDMELHTETFEEIGEISKKHAMEMAEKGDKAHIEKMEEMKNMMGNPEAMEEWFAKKHQEFDSLPEDK